MPPNSPIWGRSEEDSFSFGHILKAATGFAGSRVRLINHLTDYPHVYIYYSCFTNASNELRVCIKSFPAVG